MNLHTPVSYPTALPRLSHTDKLLMLGSCFATHIGRRLLDAKFNCDVNPFGTLYNPLSLSAALRQIGQGKVYAGTDLFLHGECWHSPLHHGDFSAMEQEEALQRINLRLQTAHKSLPQLNYLLLTWGTAWVYEWKNTGHIVGNCHKLPQKEFTRRRLSVEEIVLDYISLLEELWTQNPHIKVLFTVSPIRHVRDGLHQNQLSKATLLLAIEELQQIFGDKVCYFPAYELLLDELRDYRFYADDMVHPSTLAVDYVWEQFVQNCISRTALEIMEECEKIGKSLSHKPFHTDSEEHKRFLGQIVLKIERLNQKYPYLDFKKEIDICRIRLKA